MLKRDEAADPRSCFNRAREDELVFVLLARDPAAPRAIETWAYERVRLGKNSPNDQQVLEAIDCARRMNIAAWRGKTLNGDPEAVVFRPRPPISGEEQRRAIERAVWRAAIRAAADEADRAFAETDSQYKYKQLDDPRLRSPIGARITALLEMSAPRSEFLGAA